MNTNMSLIYTASELASVGLIQGILEDNGIKPVLKNSNLSVLAGRAEPSEWWPELWVPTDDLARAKEVLRTIKSDTDVGAAWVCPHCGETMEGQFTACWNCGTQRPPISNQN